MLIHLMICKAILVTAFIWVQFVRPSHSNPSPLATFQHAANISHGRIGLNPGDLGSNFSPRMDFEQWKPLTGRGDPLRNDPTYDYEPPVLERVHYWADDTRVERERIPEKKSEVLVLGISSRKPSVAPHQPPPAIKRTHRPPPPKFQDYTYKYSEYYPMTILVPPPPPPPGHQHSLYINPEQKLSASLPKPVDRPTVIKRPTTVTPEHLASFAVQEANLIYQSSTTSQNWFLDFNQTNALPHSPVTSDYAGWGPTTPFNDNDIVNDTHNFISNDHSVEISKPYLFYKPLLSDSPTSLITSSPQLITAFIPTALPPIDTTLSSTPTTWSATETTFEVPTEDQNTFEEAATTPTNKISSTMDTPAKSKLSLFDMLAPMMSMPLATDPERLEDNLYAHASENIHVFKEHVPEDSDKLEEMQSMKPPPPVKVSESTTVSERQPYHVNPHILNNLLHAKPSVHTHDPYLHMRFTTPITTPTTEAHSSHETKFSTEVPAVPMYLIIQGHSKVKTYSSKAKNNQNVVSQNDITKQTVSNEVKHLHPLKEKQAKKLENLNETREGRALNLKSLIDNGLGSIEIQETDLGIKYDVSDGSKVPLELYKKGFVDSDENNYKPQNESKNEKRNKREIDLDDLWTIDEDSIEDYVDDLIKGKKNDTGITQILNQIANSDVTKINVLENDDDDISELEDEDR